MPLAIIKFVPQKNGGSIKNLANYLTKDEKTLNKQVSEYDCSKDTLKEDFQAVKELHNKTDGRQYVHMVQSFKPNEVSVEEAHKVGQELKEKVFSGHQVLLVTHEDKGHIHNHFLANSVNMDTGKKWHQDAKKLYEIRGISDGVCKDHCLSVLKQRKNRYLDMKELRTAEKGKSWKFRLMAEIDHARNISKSKEEFIKAMNGRGYEVNWTDSRKNITYTTPEGLKCRDSKLSGDYSKEVMENEIRGSQGQEQTARVEQRGSDLSRDYKRDSKEGSKDIDRGNDRSAEFGNSGLSGRKNKGVKRDAEKGITAESGGLQEHKAEGRKLDEQLSRTVNKVRESKRKDDNGHERDSGEPEQDRKGDGIREPGNKENYGVDRGADGESIKDFYETVANISGRFGCAVDRANNQRHEILKEREEEQRKTEKSKKKDRDRGWEMSR
jgi:hypothetical protein